MCDAFNETVLKLWTADLRYERFRRDVKDFEAVLNHLQTVHNNASQRYNDRGAVSAIDPEDEAFDTERQRLIGNYNTTLEEAKAVLTRNKIARHNSAQGVLLSLKWAAGVENKVDELRARLRLHSHKMLLVSARLSYRLMNDNTNQLDDILGLAEQNEVQNARIIAMLQDMPANVVALLQGRVPPGIPQSLAEPPQIPDVVAQRFQGMLLVNAPPGFVTAGYNPRKIPMAEGFDTLMVHWTESVDVTSDSHTPEHHIRLLKATWLVGQLQASEGYHNARPGYYYRRAIAQLARQLSARMRDPRLLSIDVSMLGALPAETYQIWPAPQPTISVSQMEAKPGEIEEIRLDLVVQAGFTQQRIAVFRRGESRFRIVQENIPEGNGTPQQIPLHFNMEQECFIPTYSLPEADHSAHEVAISNQASGQLETYRFRSKENLNQFQSVLLGHRMVYEQTSVAFKMSHGVQGTGRLQIWQEPINTVPLPNGSLTSSSSSTRSPESFQSSRRPSLVSSTTPTTLFRHAEGIEGASVPSPALLILTELQGVVAYIYMKLDIPRVMHELCECRDEEGYKRCSSLGLARTRRQRFPIRIKSADVDPAGHSIVSSCDLSVFRSPTHPGFRSLKPMRISWLKMTFGDPVIKDAFNLELHQRFALRDELERRQADLDTSMIVNSERPRSELTIRPSASRSSNALTRTASRAPSVGSLQLGNNFSQEISDAVSMPPARVTVEQNNESLQPSRPLGGVSEATIRNTPQRANVSRQMSSSSSIRSVLRSLRS